jgi:hypothetical protein
LRSCTGKGQIRFLESTLRATAPNLHDGSSSIQVKRRYVPAYPSSTATSSSSTAHRRPRATIASGISITSDVVSLCSWKVYTP